MDRAVDHVYYRDLVVLEAIVLAVQASDHNAMRVTFKQAGADAA
jgi:endonuclease/exonuclease/phosphatase (EEP) superfamily protein YafD